MRVLQLISGLMYGGGQKVALDLAAGLRRQAGVEADVGLLGCSEGRLRDAAAFVVDYDGNYTSLPSLARTAWRLRAALRERDYDLVHSHGWDADLIGRWALGDRPEPQLVHLHVTPSWVRSGSLKHRVRRTMTRRLLAARQVGVVAVSHAVKEHWAEIFAGAAPKMRVVHNGVDVDHFRPVADEPGQEWPPDRPFVLGTACRLAPQKGLSYLLDALPKALAAAGRPVRLDIAGTGPLYGALEAQSASLGLGGQVRFLGALQDMPSFYCSIDLAVLPAISDEGLPLMVLEAMASGIPAVATDVGGTGEAVRDGIDGRVVPPRDAAALGAALSALIADEAQRRAMGLAARQRACRAFPLSAQIDRTAALYRELLDETREGRSLAA